MTDAQHDLPPSGMARVFGAEAARYDLARPSYPAEAVARVLDALAPSDRPPGRIVDVGAGTGKLTALLVDRAAEVVAVEPDPQMLSVLAGRLPQVRALPGSAERIPLADGSVDAILAGQAFHWFSRPDADREFARVLRPGGVVGLLWNIPDRSVEWVDRLYQATRRPEFAGSEFNPLDEQLFGPVEEAVVPSAHRLAGPDAVRDLVHSWSWVITRSAAEQDAIDQRLRILVTRYPELQGPVVEMPQRTDVVWQLRR